MSPGGGVEEQDIPPSLLHWWRVLLKAEYERIYTDCGVAVAFSTAQRHKGNCLICPCSAAKTPFPKISSYPMLTSCLLQTVSEAWLFTVRLMLSARYLGKHTSIASCSLPALLAKERTSIFRDVNPASFSSANFPLENSPRAIAHWAVTSC